jgi:hypothetical protein
MRVFDISPSTRGPLAFEINSWLGRRHAARIVATIPGVHVLRRPRLFARSGEEVFCEFELNGQRFNVWEPHGNSSRYWIGPSSGTKTPVLMQVRQVFIDYKLPARRGIVGWLRKGKGSP